MRGRTKALGDKKRKLLIKLYDDQENSIAELMDMFHIYRSTLFKIVKEEKKS